jgi:hypothetical protein
MTSDTSPRPISPLRARAAIVGLPNLMGGAADLHAGADRGAEHDAHRRSCSGGQVRVRPRRRIFGHQSREPLRQSRLLVMLASPEAAASAWVEKELAW